MSSAGVPISTVDGACDNLEWRGDLYAWRSDGRSGSTGSDCAESGKAMAPNAKQ